MKTIIVQDFVFDELCGMDEECNDAAAAIDMLIEMAKHNANIAREHGLKVEVGA